MGPVKLVSDSKFFIPASPRTRLKQIVKKITANINQSVPNLATIYMPIWSRMSSIMDQIEQEHPELFALEFGKIAEYDCLLSIIYKY